MAFLKSGTSENRDTWTDEVQCSKSANKLAHDSKDESKFPPPGLGPGIELFLAGLAHDFGNRKDSSQVSKRFKNPRCEFMMERLFVMIRNPIVMTSTPLTISMTRKCFLKRP